MTTAIRNTRRPHCTCVVVQNYGYKEAARKLGIQPRWLQDNIRRLTHQKIGGGGAVFCDCELRLIQDMHTVLVASAEEVPPAQPESPSAAPSLRSIRPSGSRRHTQTAI